MSTNEPKIKCRWCNFSVPVKPPANYIWTRDDAWDWLKQHVQWNHAEHWLKISEWLGDEHE